MRDFLAFVGGVLAIFCTLICPVGALVDSIVKSGENHLFFVLAMYIIWWFFACVRVGTILEEETKK